MQKNTEFLLTNYNHNIGFKTGRLPRKLAGLAAV